MEQNTEQNAEQAPGLESPDQPQFQQGGIEAGQEGAPGAEEQQPEPDWKVEHAKLSEAIKKEQADKKALTGQLNKLAREGERLDRIEGNVTSMRLIMEALAKHQAAGTVDELPQEMERISQRHQRESIEQRVFDTGTEVYNEIMGIAKDFELDPLTAPELAEIRSLYQTGVDGKDTAMIERAGRLVNKLARDLDRNSAKEQTVEAKKAAGALSGTATSRSMSSGKLSGDALAQRVAIGQASGEEKKRYLEERGLTKYLTG